MSVSLPAELTVKNLRQFGRDYLKLQNCDHGDGFDVVALETDLLLGEVLKYERIGLHLHSQDLVQKSDADVFVQFLQRRATGEPIAYILGRREFWGLSFLVSPAVLVPRPETELVVSVALKHLHRAQLTLVDVGVGSGAIILSLLDELRAREGESFLADVCAIGVDRSSEALEVCLLNAKKFSLDKYLKLSHSSLLDRLSELRRYQRLVVVSNPPYIPVSERLPVDVYHFEPESALRAGEDGLSIFRELAEQLRPLFAEGVVFIAEHGQGQEEQIALLLRESGAKSIEHHKDLAGIVRVIEAKG